MAKAIEVAALQTIAQWRPTTHDAALGDFSALARRQDWLVCPVMRTRGSDVLTRANWAAQDNALAAQAALDEVETHTFNHWACGWYELVIVKPNTRAHEIAAEIACSLEGYGVLSDEIYAETEYENAREVWDRSDVIETLRDAGVSERTLEALSMDRDAVSAILDFMLSNTDHETGAEGQFQFQSLTRDNAARVVNMLRGRGFNLPSER